MVQVDRLLGKRQPRPCEEALLVGIQASEVTLSSEYFRSALQRNPRIARFPTSILDSRSTENPQMMNHE